MKRYFLVLISFGFLFYSSCTVTKKKIQVESTVVIAGGGVSGVSAALQVARMGEKVILVEESPWLGGMLTAAGASAAEGNVVLPSGIWGEFIDKLVEHFGAKESLMTGWASQIQFEPSIGKNILHQFVAEDSNITVYHGFWLTKSIKTGNKLVQLVFENNSNEILEVSGKLFIDATEYGDLLAQAEEPYRFGLESKSETGEKWAPVESYPYVQDLTYVAVVSNLGNGKDNLIDEPDDYNPELFDCACVEVCSNQSNTNGVDCAKMLDYGKLRNNKYLIKWPNKGNDYYLNLLELNHQERIKVLEKAKEHTLSWIYFMQNRIGKKELMLVNEFGSDDALAWIPYIRESRRLKGEFVLTLNDILDPYENPKRPLYKAAIAVGDYSINQHREKNPVQIKLELPKIPSYSIPLTSLYAKNTINLIVAEKNISVTGLVNGTTRLQPVVFEIGQAAGALAAISIQERVSPSNVNIRLVQQVLLDYGCWLMPYFDIDPFDEFFQEVQRLGTSGIMKGDGFSTDSLNQTRFNPYAKATHSDLEFAIHQLGYESLNHTNQSILTRQEMVLRLWEILDKPSTQPFDLDYTDVRRNSELFRALTYFNYEDLNSMWLEQETFGIQETVLRWELAVWLDKVFEPYLNDLYLADFIELNK